MNGVEQAWEYVKQSPELYSRGFERGREVGESIEATRDLRGVLFIGMGGSGIAGDITQDLLPKPYKIPVHVIKDYFIPFKVDEGFLVIAVSYSGTTAETITAAAQARRQGAKMVFITSGGDMMEIAEKNGIPVVEVTRGLQPRFATPEMVGASYGLLTSTGLVGDEERIIFSRCLEELRSFVSSFSSAYSGEPAEAAEALAGKPIVIYSHSHLISSGYRFKAQLNENAKHPAFHSILPEAGHNEFEAWPANLNVNSVILRSGWEKPALRGLISWMLEELERRGVRHHQMRVDASSPTAEILKLIALIDFTSLALARRNNVNPMKLEILPQVRRALKFSSAEARGFWVY